MDAILYSCSISFSTLDLHAFPKSMPNCNCSPQKSGGKHGAGVGNWGTDKQVADDAVEEEKTKHEENEGAAPTTAVCQA